MRTRTSSTSRLVAAAAAGSLAGYAVESVHRSAGVWRLPEDGALPPWIVLAYFLGLLLFGLALRAVEGGAGLPPPTSRRAAVEALLLAALFFAPPLLHPWETSFAVASTAYLLGRLLVARAPGDVTIAAATVALDLAAERSMVAAGLYRYSSAAHGALPLWLAPLWGGIALSLRHLARLSGRERRPPALQGDAGGPPGADLAATIRHR